MSRKYNKSKRLLEVREGHSFIFYNFEKNGERISIGVPKDDCENKDYYLGVNGETKGYMARSKGQAALASGFGSMSSSRQLGTGSSGTCNACGKKLRGNTRKPLCYSCWSS